MGISGMLTYTDNAGRLTQVKAVPRYFRLIADAFLATPISHASSRGCAYYS